MAVFFLWGSYVLPKEDHRFPKSTAKTVHILTYYLLWDQVHTPTQLIIFNNCLTCCTASALSVKQDKVTEPKQIKTHTGETALYILSIGGSMWICLYGRLGDEHCTPEHEAKQTGNKELSLPGWRWFVVFSEVHLSSICMLNSWIKIYTCLHSLKIWHNLTDLDWSIKVSATLCSSSRLLRGTAPDSLSLPGHRTEHHGLHGFVATH